MCSTFCMVSGCAVAMLSVAGGSCRATFPPMLGLYGLKAVVWLGGMGVAEWYVFSVPHRGATLTSAPSTPRVLPWPGFGVKWWLAILPLSGLCGRLLTQPCPCSQVHGPEVGKNHFAFYLWLSDRWVVCFQFIFSVVHFLWSGDYRWCLLVCVVQPHGFQSYFSPATTLDKRHHQNFFFLYEPDIPSNQWQSFTDTAVRPPFIR